MTALELLTYGNAVLGLAMKIFGLAQQVNAGTIKPEDLRPEDLRVATWDEIVAKSRAQETP